MRAGGAGRTGRAWRPRDLVRPDVAVEACRPPGAAIAHAGDRCKVPAGEHLTVEVAGIELLAMDRLVDAAQVGASARTRRFGRGRTRVAATRRLAARWRHRRPAPSGAPAARQAAERSRRRTRFALVGRGPAHQTCRAAPGRRPTRLCARSAHASPHHLAAHPRRRRRQVAPTCPRTAPGYAAPATTPTPRRAVRSTPHRPLARHVVPGFRHRHLPGASACQPRSTPV